MLHGHSLQPIQLVRHGGVVALERVEFGMHALATLLSQHPQSDTETLDGGNYVRLEEVQFWSYVPKLSADDVLATQLHVRLQ